MMNARVLIAGLTALACMGCGGGSASGALSVSWSFDAGDCASNSVETVHVTWTLNGGATEEASFACSDGTAELGEIPEAGGTYSIQADGIDAGGVVRAASYGQTTSFSQAADFPPIDITLHPATANVVVSWTLAGGGPCPSGVILPYYVTLYRPPAVDGGDLTDNVTEVQESCASGQATLLNVAPGDYVVEIDSRAVTPAIRGTTPLTVQPGEDTTVTLDL